MFPSASCATVKFCTKLRAKNFQTTISMHTIIDANTALATGEVLDVWYNHISQHHLIMYIGAHHVM
jgi:hypothetical protein